MSSCAFFFRPLRHGLVDERNDLEIEFLDHFEPRAIDQHRYEWQHQSIGFDYCLCSLLDTSPSREHILDNEYPLP